MAPVVSGGVDIVLVCPSKFSPLKSVARAPVSFPAAAELDDAGAEAAALAEAFVAATLAATSAAFKGNAPLSIAFRAATLIVPSPRSAGSAALVERILVT